MTGNEIIKMKHVLDELWFNARGNAIDARYNKDLNDPTLYGSIIHAHYYDGAVKILEALRRDYCSIIEHYTYGDLNVEFDGIKQALIDLGEELKKI